MFKRGEFSYNLCGLALLMAIFLLQANFVIGAISPAQDCIDSDGKDIYNRGTVILNSPIDYKIATDYCYDEFSVNEAYCDGTGNLGLTTYTCFNGCSNGACIKEKKASIAAITGFATATTTLTISAVAAGPLTVLSSNPRYFTDGSGKVIYLTGSHTWDNLQDWGGSTPNFDYTAYLNLLKLNNHNFIRLWSAWVGGAGEPNGSTLTSQPIPWQRTGPGTANDGGLKYDLSKFNQAYFDRLRSRVIAARDQGIYVDIMMFLPARYSQWAYSPYNPSNNINGINGDPNGDGTPLEVETLDNAALVALQESYVKKVIDTVNDLDNVLYEIINEAKIDSVQWQYRMINLIKNYEATKPKQHPVGMTSGWQLHPDDTPSLLSSPADWISLREYNPSPAPATKVSISDTDHIFGGPAPMTWFWKSFTRGHNPINMEAIQNGIPAWIGQSWNDPNNSLLIPGRKQMGYTLTYANKMNLAAMTPRGDLTSTTYALANPGNEYLVYQPNSGQAFTVNLAAGTYSYEWFNPTTGAIASTGTITATAGSRSFTAPFSGDAVLYLKITSPPAFDFSLTNGGNKSVNQGSSVTNSVTATLVSGTSQSVSFSVTSGLPSGATASFSPTSCIPNCPTVITINTLATTPVGTYTVTITGTATGVTPKTTTFTLTVNPITTGAKTYYVATTGSDANTCAQAQSSATPKKTINAGIGCLAGGDTLIIKAGTYAEGINTGALPSGLSDTQRTVIKGVAGETVIIKPATSNNIGDAVSIYDRSYITLDNLVIDGTNVNSVVVRIGGGESGPFSHFITIQNSTVRNGLGIGYEGSGIGTCITQQGPGGANSNLKFINLDIYTCGINSVSPQHAHGIYLTARDSLIENSRIHDSSGHGIHQYSGSGGVHNNIIRNNIVYNNSAYGIGVYSGSNGLVYNNVVYNNGKTFAGTGGIRVYGASGVKIYNNILYNNGFGGGPGIHIGTYGASIGTSVKNNIIKNSSGAPVYIFDADDSNTVIEDNIFHGNGNSNLIVNNGAGTIIGSGATANLVADPLFVSVAANDFHLQSTSPAINTGAALSEVTTDFDGITRPRGSAYDIGAYEFVGTPAAFDFTLTNGGSKSVNQGSSVTNSVTATLVSGTSQSVSFSAPSLPTGAIATFSPTSCTPTCPTTLTISTLATTPAGIYTITVTGTATGAAPKTTSFTLTVNTVGTVKTYYVATTGSDTNPGTSASPFKTIQKAADMVQPGDRVIVKAGIYYERVMMKTSGTTSAPIVFEGEPGAIIDGSEPTSGWVTAPEIGPGVYKTTAIPYNPYAMIADGDKNIARIHDDNMQTNQYVNWKNLLATPVDATEQTLCGGNPFVTVKSWDGVEAYFGYLNGTTYIRFKNGDNPTTRNVRSSPGPAGCFNCWPMGAAVRIEDKSYVHVKSFTIRGAQWGVTLKGANAAFNNIEGNSIMNGLGRVYIALGAHDNMVRGNKMELNQLGFDKYHPGADSAAATCDPTKYSDPYAIGVKSRYYQIFKYWVGDSSENNADTGVKIRSSAGANNVIADNEIFNGIVGVDIAEATGVRVRNNTIHNMAAEGIFILGNVIDLQIYDNLFYDSDINIRPQNMNEGNRLVYIYRNRIYNPHLLGAENFYFHFWPDSPPPSSYPEFFIYHNSIVGGHIAFGIGDAVPAGGMPKARFINNIFSSYQFYTPWVNSTFTTSPSMVGAFDYNWAGGKYARGVPAWFGSNNVNAQNQQMWNDTTMPDFKLLPGSNAIDAGIDISKPFTINGVNYSALPGFSPGYFSGTAPDIGVYEFVGTPGAKIYYMSPTGSDTNSGTSSTFPWQTFTKAIPALNPGDTLILLDGTYTKSNSGLFYADCTVNARSGTASAPITVKAENQRKAFIQGDGALIPGTGSARPVTFVKCSWWVVDGLRIQNQDNAANTGSNADVFAVQTSNYITLKNSLLAHPNLWGNSGVIGVQYGSHDILIEDNEVYYSYRNAVDSACSDCYNIVIRRNYVNPLGAPCLNTVVTPPCGGPGHGAIVIYRWNNSTVENNIIEGAASAISGNGKNNRIFGNIDINNNGHGAVVAHHPDDLVYDFPADTTIKDQVCVGSPYQCIFLRTAGNILIENFFAFNTGGTAFVADNNYDSRRVPNDNCHGGPCLHEHTPGVTLRNGLVVNSYGGYYVNGASEFSPRIFEYSHGWNNTNGTWRSGTETRDPATTPPSGKNVDPNFGTCRVFVPDGSPMKGAGKNGADIGANVLYAYENGVLTSKKLWNPTTGEWAFRGAIIPGVNDPATLEQYGAGLSTVHKRLNVNTNGCALPASYTGPVPFDFSLSNEGSKSVNQGQSVTNSVTATLTPGTTPQSVSFSASGLPSGAIPTFSPTSCSPTCTITLNISTSVTTPVGAYAITVTGTSNVTKTTTFTLTVNSTTPPKIPGDLNDDGKVDLLDILIITRDFGKIFGFDPRADAAPPYGSINIFDVMFVIKNWGASLTNDTIPPTVSITAPASGSTVSGITQVSATASDNVGVAGVQFKLDGANLGAEYTTSPYSISWDTTITPNGPHTLTAVARDAAGNNATSTAVSVNVNNPVVAKTYYVATTGNDTNIGTSATSPWKTFTKAIPALNPGDTLILLDGNYTTSGAGKAFVNCGTGTAKNGTASASITIKAQNERKAVIKHDLGSGYALSFYGCSWWNVEGLTFQGGTWVSGGITYIAEDFMGVGGGSSNINVKRNLMNGPVAGGIVVSGGSHDVLVEENELYKHERNGIYPISSHHNTFRRNYCRISPRSGYAIPGSGGPQGCFVSYYATDIIYENNIAEAYSGDCLHDAGQRNRYLGDIGINCPNGISVSKHPQEGMLNQDNYVENFVSVGGPATFNGISANSAINLIVRSISVFGGIKAETNTGNGIIASNGRDPRRGPGACGVYTPNGTCKYQQSPGITAINVLVNGAPGGYYINNADEFAIRKFSYDVGWNNSGGTWKLGTETRDPATTPPPGISATPDIGSCKVFIPDSSSLKGRGEGGADIGANVLYAYENGVLTSKKLWNPTTGEWTFRGAIIPGINDIAGQSLFDVHKRLNVNFNGCSLPAWYGGVPAFDFSLSNGGSKSVNQGSSVTNSVTATLVSGTAQSVSFSTSSLPTGATATFSPTSCTPDPTCPTTITISTLSTTPTGTYTITVTGTATGAAPETTSFTLTVSATTPGGKFLIGDRVQTTAYPTLDVRATPSTSGTILGAKLTDSRGKVIGGPTVADGFTWWQIDFDNPPDGWVAENYLEKPIISRFFQKDSTWNTKIPSSPVINPNSANYINDIIINGAGLGAIYKEWGVAVFYARPDTPNVTVNLRDPKSKAIDKSMGWDAVPIPPEAVPPGNAASLRGERRDGHMAIISADRKYVWTFGGFTTKYPNGSWSANYLRKWDLSKDGIQSPYDYLGAQRRGYVPHINGLTTYEDIKRGYIDHAMAFSYWTGSNVSHWGVYPSEGYGGGNPPNSPWSLLEGMRLQLDPSINLDAYPLSPAGKIVAKALQEYGAIFVENAGKGTNAVDAEELTDKPDQWGSTWAPMGISLDPNFWRIVENPRTWPPPDAIKVRTKASAPVYMACDTDPLSPTFKYCSPFYIPSTPTRTIAANTIGVVSSPDDPIIVSGVAWRFVNFDTNDKDTTQHNHGWVRADLLEEIE